MFEGLQSGTPVYPFEYDHLHDYANEDFSLNRIQKRAPKIMLSPMRNLINTYKL